MRLEVPKSMANRMPGTSTRMQVLKRPPEPNASPLPTNVTFEAIGYPTIIDRSRVAHRDYRKSPQRKSTRLERRVLIRNLGWGDRDRFRRVRSGAYRPDADLRAVGGPQGEVAQGGRLQPRSFWNTGRRRRSLGQQRKGNKASRRIGSGSSHWRKRLLRIGLATAHKATRPRENRAVSIPMTAF